MAKINKVGINLVLNGTYLDPTCTMYNVQWSEQDWQPNINGLRLELSQI